MAPELPRKPGAVLVLLLILAIPILLGTCMHTVRLAREDLTTDPYIVSGLVLRSNEEVRFDVHGARYDSSTRRFHGRSTDGTDRAVEDGDVKRVRFYRFVEGEPRETEVDRAVFTAAARRESNETIERVVTADGEVVEFDSRGGRLSISPWEIRGFGPAGDIVGVPLEDVLYVEIRRVDPVMTAVAILGVGAVLGTIAAAIAVAMKESCPFVYSYDGEAYILDAEPLGGAITKGMERTDLSRLERIRPVDGCYRVLFRNEVEETQKIDCCELLLVDHPPGATVVPAPAGGFLAVRDPILASRVVDESGRDITAFFRSRDGVAWQSHVPLDPAAPLPTVRHSLTATIPRPPRSEPVFLHIQAGATLWGSNMIRELLALHGPYTERWYAAIDQGGPAREAMDAWLGRDELYDLKVQVLEHGELRAQGSVHSNGPLVIEDRILPLDLSRVEGDSITIRFDPPFGFWSIDYVALVVDPIACSATAVIGPAATEETGSEIADRLAAQDGVYHTMEAVGEWFVLRFLWTRDHDPLTRTAFLRTSGYYRIRLPEGLADRRQELREMTAEPDGVARYSYERLREWSAQTAARLQGAPR